MFKFFSYLLMIGALNVTWRERTSSWLFSKVFWTMQPLWHLNISISTTLNLLRLKWNFHNPQPVLVEIKLSRKTGILHKSCFRIVQNCPFIEWSNFLGVDKRDRSTFCTLSTLVRALQHINSNIVKIYYTIYVYERSTFMVRSLKRL